VDRQGPGSNQPRRPCGSLQFFPKKSWSPRRCHRPDKPSYRASAHRVGSKKFWDRKKFGQQAASRPGCSGCYLPGTKAVSSPVPSSYIDPLSSHPSPHPTPSVEDFIHPPARNSFDCILPSAFILESSPRLLFCRVYSPVRPSQSQPPPKTTDKMAPQPVALYGLEVPPGLLVPAAAEFPASVSCALPPMAGGRPSATAPELENCC
jgi:hypothetical protein